MNEDEIRECERREEWRMERARELHERVMEREKGYRRAKLFDGGYVLVPIEQEEKS